RVERQVLFTGRPDPQTVGRAAGARLWPASLFAPRLVRLWGPVIRADVAVTQRFSRAALTSGAGVDPPAPQNPHHIFVFVPAYKVEYGKNVPPLTPREKFSEFLESTYDPLGLSFSAGETLVLEHSPTDGFCGYGHGIGGYAECYGAARLDANVSGFFGDFLFPVWMHQDPRYFRLGRGSIGLRILYAISRVFATRSDTTRHAVFDGSALAGTALAGVMSNLYYPQADRGLGLTMSRIAIDLGGTATFNLAAEFWEDIKTKLFHWKN
ncbi:MAG TPA: hypothetical protein VIC33_17655, partial [Vicinamibacterales bacterium]